MPSRLGEYIRNRGAIEADYLRRRGDISAQLGANLATIAGDTISGIVSAREQQKQQAEEKRKQSVSQQIREALKLTRDPETGTLDVAAAQREVMTIDPIEGLKVWETLDTVRRAEVAADMKKAEGIARAAKFLLTAPEPQRPQLYQQMRGRFAEEHGIPIESIPEQYDEQWIRQRLAETLPFTQAIEEMGKYAQSLHDTDGVDLEVEDEHGNLVKKRFTLADLQKGVVTRRAKKVEEKTPTNIEAAILDAEGQGDQARVDRLIALRSRLAAATREPNRPDQMNPRQVADLESRMRADLRRLDTSFTQNLRTLDRELNEGVIGPDEHSQRRFELEMERDEEQWLTENIFRRATGQPDVPPPSPPVRVRRGVGAPEPPATPPPSSTAPMGATPASAAPPRRGDIRLPSSSVQVPQAVTAVLANEPEGLYTLSDGSRWRKLPDGRIEPVK